MTSLIQDGLSKAQAIPLLGVPVSVIKASFSILEMVASLALLILSLPFGEASKDLKDSAAYHLNEGWDGLTYSVANFLTIGIYGNMVEFEPLKDDDHFRSLCHLHQRQQFSTLPNITQQGY